MWSSILWGLFYNLFKKQRNNLSTMQNNNSTLGIKLKEKKPKYNDKKNGRNKKRSLFKRL